MKNITLFLSTLAIFAFIYSCKKPSITGKGELIYPTLPLTPYDYSNSRLPGGQTVKDFALNASAGVIFTNGFGSNIATQKPIAVTDDGSQLGRVLFYDINLSLNNTVSCGTCHKQDFAFTDGAAGSIGFEGRVTNRSSMAFTNPITQNNLFWDSRSASLQDLALRPVQNHIEMGMEDIDKLVKKLSAIPYYPSLFQKAYGSPEITKEKLSDAISQFVASITTSNSKFDKSFDNMMIKLGNGTGNFVFNNNNLIPSNGFPEFTELENIGMQIFHGRGECSGCHAGTNFSAPDGPGGAYGSNSFFGGGTNQKGTTNIGLDFIYKDNGLENGKFKIPGLRNIALTAPYMHDGRFKTLNDVLDHYSKNIKPHKDLDPKFRNPNGSVRTIDLSEADKIALVAFLNTLTDEQLLKDPKYSDPFKH